MKAVATLLYNADYLPGALVLGSALRKIIDGDTKLVVLIEKSQFSPFQLNLLLQVWHVLIDTTVYQSQLHHKLIYDLQRPELGKTFTKAQLWDLPYDKVLYLDADTLPLVGKSNVCDLLKLDLPVGKVIASPDAGFPDVFNSGMLVLTPNKSDHLNLLSLVLSGNPNVSFDGADQGLLNQYFNLDPDWVQQHLDQVNGLSSPTSGSNWIRVPFLYNTTPSAHYQYFPAFNHFQNPPELLGSDLAETQLVGSELAAPDLAGKFAQLALSSYHSTAFGHFSSSGQSQVKLLHFIGPVKPWHSDESGLHGKWWSQWYEYSNGKLLHDVLYRLVYPIVVKDLVVPGKAPETQATHHHHFDVEQHQPTESHYPEINISTPADLCDPSNYQHFATETPQSAVSWDATREEPPSQTPSGSEFDDAIRTFSSNWIYEKTEEEKSEESDGHEADDEEGLENWASENDFFEGSRDPAYGVHQDQRAERVFDKSSDFMPKHYLLMKKKAISQAARERSSENGKKKKPVEGVESIDLELQEEEMLSGIESGNSVEFNDAEVHRSVTTEGGFPKLFPWEFRENHLVERSWE